MKKSTLYIDTSVWNAPFADDAPDFQAMTKDFFKRQENYSLAISTLTLEEIEACPEPKRARILNLIKESNPEVYELNDEIKELTDKYLSYGLMLAKFRNDALHLAIASYYDADYVVSLNFEHIVRERTREVLRGINAIVGFHSPIIVFPGEI
jgi:predicted nucleic acid-binding protein